MTFYLLPRCSVFLKQHMLLTEGAKTGYLQRQENHQKQGTGRQQGGRGSSSNPKAVRREAAVVLATWYLLLESDSVSVTLR